MTLNTFQEDARMSKYNEAVYLEELAEAYAAKLEVEQLIESIEYQLAEIAADEYYGAPEI